MIDKQISFFQFSQAYNITVLEMDLLRIPFSIFHGLIIWAISNRVLRGTKCMPATMGLDLILVTIRYLLGSSSLYWHRPYQQYFASLLLIFSLFDSNAYFISYFYLIRYFDIFNIVKDLEKTVKGKGWSAAAKVVIVLKYTIFQVVFLKIVGLVLRTLNPALKYPQGQLHVQIIEIIKIQLGKIFPSEWGALVLEAPQKQIFIVWAFLFLITYFTMVLLTIVKEKLFGKNLELKKKQIKIVANKHI